MQVLYVFAEFSFLTKNVAVVMLRYLENANTVEPGLSSSQLKSSF